MKSFLAILIALLSVLPHPLMPAVAANPVPDCAGRMCGTRCPCCKEGACECCEKNAPPAMAPQVPIRVADQFPSAALPPQPAPEAAPFLTAMLPACATCGVNALAETIAPKGVKLYSLKTCIVAGNDFTSMGDGQRIVHNGLEIKLCCKPCIAKFRKNPEKYLVKLR